MSEKLPQHFDQSTDLYQQIIAGNLEVHLKDAPLYDVFHGELFNWYEQRRIRRDLAIVLRLARGRTVLDIGCGTGNLTLKFADKRCQVTALDLSQPMLDILNAKLPGYNMQVEVICENVDSYLERNTAIFDIITLSSVLHHLPNYFDTLEKLTQRIAPGGILYLTHEPTGRSVHPNSLRRSFYIVDSLLWRYVSGAWRHRRPKIDWEYSDYHAHHGFDSQAVIGYVQDQGFNITRQTFYTATMRLGINNAIDNIVFKPKTHFSLIAQKIS